LALFSFLSDLVATVLKMARTGGNNRLAYHFTHIDNLDAVFLHRALCCDSIVQASGTLARETADLEMKERRRNVEVPVGGVLADYVPFYFAPLSPMMLNLATGRIPGYEQGQTPFVFVVVDVDDVIRSGAACVATDGHPVSPFTSFLNDREAIEDGVDWDLMRETYWNDTDDDGDRMRRRQAEFLVRDTLPIAAILGLGVRTDTMKGAVESKATAAGLQVQVLVRPGFYYVNKP
jgi:hypothetical protein